MCMLRTLHDFPTNVAEADIRADPGGKLLAIDVHLERIQQFD